MSKFNNFPYVRKPKKRKNNKIVSGALEAVSGKMEGAAETETVSDLALASIKNITRNAEVALDLHSAVYMFYFVQALIKHVSVRDAYGTHVGKRLLTNENPNRCGFFS